MARLVFAGRGACRPPLTHAHARHHGSSSEPHFLRPCRSPPPRVPPGSATGGSVQTRAQDSQSVCVCERAGEHPAPPACLPGCSRSCLLEHASSPHLRRNFGVARPPRGPRRAGGPSSHLAAPGRWLSARPARYARSATLARAASALTASRPASRVAQRTSNSFIYGFIPLLRPGLQL
jgi:hypothetical protein